jgi:glycosyltransferase involved in cell wall biosynthesis
MTQLLILTAGEFTRDPRARRAAIVGLQTGLEVVGVSGSVTGDVPREFEAIPIERVGGDNVSGALRTIGLGGMRSSTAPIRELRGIFRLVRLLGLTLRLSRGAKRLSPAAVVHANDFDTLPAGWLIARRSGARLVYDSHEVYTSQESDPPRLFRAIVHAIEGALARRAHVITTGEPYAAELERSLRLCARPTIVLNAPARVAATPPPPSEAGPLRVIYQSAMGAGRPLDDILDAAMLTDGVTYTLRVLGVDADWLAAQIAARKIQGTVSIGDPVPPDKLIEGLWGHDVGLIINRPVSLTDALVVPNKLFEYMMAGLAVVAPNLPGLAPIVDGERVGMTFTPGDPDSMARSLQSLAADRSTTRAMGERARERALADYNAEAQAAAFKRAWGVG